MAVLAGLAWAVQAARSVPLSAPPEPAVRTLVELQQDLQSPQAPVRAQAVLALTQQQDAAALPTLRSLLQRDPSAAVRGVAAIGLGALQDRESTSAIAQLLVHDREIAADVLVDALARMADPAGAAAVLPLLDSDNDVLRLQAVEALVAMQAQDHGTAILRMARANRDVEKAKTFAMVLGKLRVTQAQDYLLQLARDTEPSPTLAASYLALGRIGSVRAVPMLAQAMGQDFEKGRENAREALIALRSPQALPAMLAYLGHGNREIRFSAAQVMAHIPDAASEARLLQILRTPGSVGAGPAAYALGRLKVQAAVTPVAELLADKASPEREVLAQTLGWLGAREHIALLMRVLAEDEGDARYGAAWSLGVLQAEEALDALQRAASGNNLKLANYAIEALGMIRSEASLGFLVRKAKDAPELANGVMASIANIAGRPAAQALEKFAAHEDLRISRPALQALAQRKDASTVAALMELMDSVEPDNRKQVYLALSAVTGQKLSSAQAWHHWYAQRETQGVKR